MLAKLITWLKWRIAGAELANLARYRATVENARHMLAEFSEVADTLDHIKAMADGRAAVTIRELRDELRRNRSAMVDAAVQRAIPVLRRRPHSDTYEWTTP